MTRHAALFGLAFSSAIAAGFTQAPGGITFTDVTGAAGIRFVHNSGRAGQKWLPETLGSGVAFFDADVDRLLERHELDGDLVRLVQRVAAHDAGLGQERLAGQLDHELVHGAGLDGRGQNQLRPAAAQVADLHRELRARLAGHALALHFESRSRLKNASSSA